jgi:hypothetical protein
MWRRNPTRNPKKTVLIFFNSTLFLDNPQKKKRERERKKKRWRGRRRGKWDDFLK